MVAAFNWKGASKASICAFMLAFAPLTASWAQTTDSADDADYVAPAAPAADDSDGDIAPAAPAAAEPAAPAAPAAAAAAPAAAASTGAAAAVPSSSQTTQLGDIAVTGSALSGADKADALPVTSYSADELREQGITSTPQILNQISSSSSSSGPGLSTGSQVTGGASFADLRGLGPNKTLILLNGRRLATNSLEGNGAATDLNTIPFAAIDHIEVLRDSASALYGTDAIGGVINFITKKNLQGGGVDLQYTAPTRAGGGDSQTLSATFGKGDLNKDGWNVLGTISYQRASAIDANTRDFVTPLNPRIRSTSSNTFPGNYAQGGIFANPQPGCDTPGALPDTIFGGSGSGSCRENYTALGAQVQQRYDQPSFFGDAQYKINDNNKVDLSYLYSKKTTYSVSAPAPTSGQISVQPGTPFYPGNGIVPAPTAAQGGADFDPNDPVSLYYRSNPLGQRVNRSENENHRVVLNFTGRFLKDYHYDTAFSYNQSSTDYYLQSGEFNQYIGDDSLEDAINNGQFNPFDPNLSQSERAALASTETTGDLESGKTRAYVWDGKVDRDIGDWFGAGQSALALGAQYRHETLDVSVDSYLAPRAPSSGLSANKISEDRDVESVFGELNVPLPFNVELDAQGRYDNYSDVGDTLNPKVSLRWQPIDQLTLRASYAEGFHAPTLFDLYQPLANTYSEGGLDDPILCPGGTADSAAGGSQTRDCDTQFQEAQGGNQNLKPEKSKSWSAGFVLTPIKYVTLTADFWAVELSQQIGVASGSYALARPDQFPVTRNDDGAIDYFVNQNQNLGKTQTNGEDIQLQAYYPSDLGTFTLQMQGTYTNKYDFQNVKGGQYYNNVSEFSSASNQVIFRWKHTVTLGWNKGPYALGVVNHYSSGYRDSTVYPGHYGVHDYVTWDTYGSYRFDNGLQFTVGANNVFDVDPVYSTQTYAGQAGYDARYADGVGRTVYGRLSYKF
ncbi:TonB-dependent receptor [Salinisphaera sp. Q1T1-3]|nr:TonB-dependent receptor [Salinisphaera sp. Q1T1-3]